MKKSSKNQINSDALESAMDYMRKLAYQSDLWNNQLWNDAYDLITATYLRLNGYE